MFSLNFALLVEISGPETVRKDFLRHLFSIIFESAISTFDFDDYSISEGIIQKFYKEALALGEDSASNLLRQLVKKASGSKARDEYFVRIVLESLIKELVDTASLKTQPWLELLVEAYIKAAGTKKPSKSHIEAAKQKLQKMPKLKQALGNDRYIRLIGSAAQAADKAQPSSQSKRKKNEDTNGARSEGTSKRARGGEQNENPPPRF